MRIMDIILAVVSICLCMINSVFSQETWYKTYGGRESDYGTTVIETSDSCFVVLGSTNGSSTGYPIIYVAKTDISGNLLWEKTYGNHYRWTYPGDIVETVDNGLLIIADTYDPDSTGDSDIIEDRDILMLRLNSVGDTVWVKQYGSMYQESGMSVNALPDGGFLVGGTLSYERGKRDFYLIRTDANGDSLWTRVYGGVASDWLYDCEITDDGGFIMAGRSLIPEEDTFKILLIKTDSFGITEWERVYGSSNKYRHDYLIGIVQADDGGYIGYAASYSFANGPAVFRFDHKGEIEWYVPLFESCDGSSSIGIHGRSNTIAYHPDFGIAVMAQAYSDGYEEDVLFALLDTDGGIVWEKVFGGYGFEQTGGLIWSSCNTIIAAGSAAEYNLPKIQYDVFLMSISPEGGLAEKPKSDTIHIYQSYPNPFTEFCTIKFAVKMEQIATIRLYNVLGRQVISFAEDIHFYKGIYTFRWNGETDSGERTASGVYFLSITNNLNDSAARRIVYVKEL